MNYHVIAIDAMGGDHGPKVIIPAVVKALDTFPNTRFILVGDEQKLNKRLKKLKAALHERIEVKHASEIVEMHESPAVALRTKKDSSMRVAINLVHEGVAHACVSAGNTGALMATARFVLKTLPGVDRPAIMTTFPTVDKDCNVLDLGANIDSTAEHLLQFAVMGSEATSAVKGIAQPTVGLLNVGTEEIKGNEQVKEADKLLSECGSLNYIGYVEGNDIFKGNTDVIVCDGFVGNVALKTSEGTAKFIRAKLKKAFSKNIFTKISALFAYPVLRALTNTISPEHYNGASMLGLNGIVIKSHGSAKVLGYYHAIKEARMELENEVPRRVRAQVESILSQRKESDVQ